MKKLSILLTILLIVACKNETKEKNHNTFVPLDNTLKGSPSPKFINYENSKGGTTSLDDLKGKFVYIDLWATWCGPCKAEIPYLKKIEEEFRDKNIAFVSISIDDINDHDSWKNMIEDKNMKGVQLFANGDTQLIKGYSINSIPRFILIDDKGNILDYDTYRPSDPLLKEALNSILN